MAGRPPNLQISVPRFVSEVVLHGRYERTPDIVMILSDDCRSIGSKKPENKRKSDEPN